MAVSFVGINGRATGSGSSATITVPFTAAATNNLLLLCLAFDKASGAVNTPAGWTALGAQSGASASNAVFWRIADGTETTVTVTYATPGSGGSSALVAEVTGQHAITPVSAAVNPTYSDTASTTYVIDPPAANGAAGGLATAWITVDSASVMPWTLSAPGWANEGSSGSTSGRGSGALMTYGTPLTASEDLGAQTFTAPESDQHSGTAFVIYPAATGAPSFSGSLALTGSGTLAASGADTTIAPGALALSGGGTLTLSGTAFIPVVQHARHTYGYATLTSDGVGAATLADTQPGIATLIASTVGGFGLSFGLSFGSPATVGAADGISDAVLIYSPGLATLQTDS